MQFASRTMSGGLEAIASSLVNPHLNRLFAASQRTQGLVIHLPGVNR